MKLRDEFQMFVRIFFAPFHEDPFFVRYHSILDGEDAVHVIPLAAVDAKNAVAGVLVCPESGFKPKLNIIIRCSAVGAGGDFLHCGGLLAHCYSNTRW